ncbi:MAG: transcriptional regulator PpsR [Pseudomonadota bacterium]
MNPRSVPLPDLSGLSEWAPELAETFVSLASDIALVLDDDGVIRSVAQGGAAPLTASAHEWVGRSWADTVTGDTRGKIELLLKEVTSTGLARRREINHPLDKGGNLAVAYTAIRLGENGPLLAVGRDLGAIAAIQQRFLDAQQELERGYWRARQAEARYRLLFQVATDAVMVVDALTLEILEANQAASQLFELSVEQLVGRAASFAFERHSRSAVDELIANARASGQPAEIRARLAGKITSTSVAATPFRTEEAMRLLVRVRTMDMPGTAADLNATLARLVDSASDGVVVTDSSGRILLANPAFLKLVQMNTEVAVKGRPLMDWIGVSDEQFAGLLAQVRSQGITRRVASRLLSSDARVSQVELSAALLTEGDQECIGFTIHSVEAAAAGQEHGADDLQAAVNRLAARVGDAPLPELLRQAAALLERHFIGIAMARTEGDAGAAAGLLGVSRERLDLPPEGAGPSTPAGT